MPVPAITRCSYSFIFAEQIKYAIRLPPNRVLQDRIGYLLKRPVGRPPNEVRRFHTNFTYQAGSWTKPRRVIAKVEWHPGELYPRSRLHRHQPVAPRAGRRLNGSKKARAFRPDRWAWTYAPLAR
jgi:Transposase DDE domain group 1